MTFDVGYVKPEAYCTYHDWRRQAECEPDAPLFPCKPAGAMLLNEAAGRESQR